ncbi:MAG: right-handed parallel beta-helix repeat-containing protein, partial [Chloroflexi bacterium]|nr:right-handed parallel beta-helix repeat-containing protein [Chloroflexota bacterium]
MTLTVEPGVTVMGGELKVGGHLAALGTASVPITFTSVADNAPSQWSGLVFDGGTGVLRHVSVRYAGAVNSLVGPSPNYGSSIYMRNVQSGEVVLESSTVSDGFTYYCWFACGQGQYYGFQIINSRVRISDTLINQLGQLAGDISLYATGAGSVVTLTHSTVSGSTGYAVRMDDGATLLMDDSLIQQAVYGLAAFSGSVVTVTASTIQSNTYGLYLAGATTLFSATNSAIQNNQYPGRG